MSSATTHDDDSMSSKESWEALSSESHERDNEAKDHPISSSSIIEDHASGVTSQHQDENQAKDEQAPLIDLGEGKLSGEDDTKDATAASDTIEPLSEDETPSGWSVKYHRWFLHSAVILREEMQPSGRQPGKPGKSPLGGNYPLDKGTYEQALDIVSSLSKPPANHGTTDYPSSWSDSAAFLLQSPSPDSLEFLNSVAYRLADDIGADIVDLGLGFLEDALHSWFHTLDNRHEIFPTPAEYLLTEKGHPKTSYLRRAFADYLLHLDDRKYLVDRLLTARSWKRSTQGQAYTPRPLIILLPDVTAYTFRSSYENDEFLTLLYAEVRRRRQEAGTPTFIVGTAPSSLKHDEYLYLSDMGRKDMKHVHQKLNLDPSLVVDVSPQKPWFSAIRSGLPTATNKINWWSRLRLTLLHELHTPDSHFKGIKLVEPYACPPSPTVHAFLAHPAWTGDMTIKAFRQIVARARGKERLEKEDIEAVIVRVARSSAPLTFWAQQNMFIRPALAFGRLFLDTIPVAVFWIAAGLLALGLYVYVILAISIHYSVHQK